MGSGLLTVGYMRYIEPEWLEVNPLTIRLWERPLPSPVKLLHLSDLHASGIVSQSYLREAIRRGLQFKPDLICLTGDYISSGEAVPAGYKQTLSTLAAAAPVYATVGNHDGGRWAMSRGGFSDSTAIRRLLRDAGARVLHNDATLLSVGATRLRLVGLGDYWSREFLPASAFAARPGAVDLPTILLSHNPDSKDALRSYRWHLALCGHTHGGQLSLPLIGEPFAPVRDKRFMKGLYQWQGRQLFISKGVGCMRGMRLNCRPEISLLTLI